MIAFPLFRRLRVSNYDLYPGTEDTPGLKIDFLPGLTLVLGANGLGKSTLVLLLYRLCAGTTEIAGLPQGNLGSGQFNLAGLSNRARQTFAARVFDGAANATATLDFSIGESQVSVTRSLRNLTLLELLVDGAARQPDEESFQSVVSTLAGVNTFEDWLLSLRYLVFYFDDRRSLVWDQSAQRQLLRLLFLPLNESARWTELERHILSVDSEMRNLRAAVRRVETRLSADEQQLARSPETARELARHVRDQERDNAALENAEAAMEELQAARNVARLNSLRAAEERESAYRALEFRRLERLRRAFPSESESAAYIVSSLIASEKCLVCDHEVPDYAEELRARIDAGLCVICGSELHREQVDPDEADLDQLVRQLAKADARVGELAKHRQEAEDAYSSRLDEIARLEAAISSRSVDISRAQARLPGDQSDIKERRLEYNSMNARVASLESELEARRAEFRNYVGTVNQSIIARKDDVKNAFDEFAQDFLIDDIELSWSNEKARVGQGGETIDYPSFRVDMSGASFDSAVRRTDAEQVSESQQEFIDLAFRMALMRVAGSRSAGCLVIDAPESSLDAVFSPRAARVLMRFGDPHGENTLMVTSNLVDGGLIPTMLQLAEIGSVSNTRIVDLFSIASPTAAIREHSDEYRGVLNKLFKGPLA